MNGIGTSVVRLDFSAAFTLKKKNIYYYILKNGKQS